MSTSYLKYKSSDGIYYRLIALWVVCEAMLGGIIHGLKLPVSGLIVGSCAVVCISLIGWYVPSKHAIIKATLIVAIFKMMLSPQAPFPAYIAVFFQGLTGQLFFYNKKYFKPASILFAIIALLESGLQRILVLTIVYGNDLWTVINEFINGLTRQKVTYNYSLLLILIYTGIHFLVGLVIGIWISAIPRKIEAWKSYQTGLQTADTFPAKKVKPNSIRKIWVIIWLLMIALYIQSYYRIGDPLLPASLPLKILIRSFIIVLTWIVLVGPLLKIALHQWLQKKQTGFKTEISAILEMIPSIRGVIIHAWRSSSEKSGLNRLALFGKISLANTVSETTKEIIILTAPIGSGKTTSLLNWIEGRKNVFGILTPVIEGRRVFLNINSKEEFEMEAKGNDTDIIEVGRFRFSKTSFQKAVNVIHEGINQDGWLIIDEAGPLELKGEGFSEVLKDVLLRKNGRTIIVVREGLVEEVVKHFRIGNYKRVHSLEELNAL